MHQLTAAEYQSGRASSLGARYERLTLEARAAGLGEVLPVRQAHFDPTSQHGNQPGTTVTDFALSLRLLETSTDGIQKALELLCEAHDSAGGHLFLLLGGELMHAASYASEAPSPALHAAVREFWCRQIEGESESTTQFEHDAGPREAFIRDSVGVSLRPVLLHCTLAAKHLSVGVLVITSSRSPVPSATSNDARVAVAQYFVRTGVATGIAS